MAKRARWPGILGGTAGRWLVPALLAGTTLGTAAAQPQPQVQPVPAYAVAVATDPAAQRSADALQQAGLQALNTTMPFVVVQPSLGAGGPGPAANPDHALLAESNAVNQALQAGLQAMTNLELDAAATSFTEIVTRYEDKPALTLITGAQPLAQALVNLAINSFLQGDQSQTEEFFRYSISLDPTQMPDPELFPDVLTVYSSVADEIGSRSLVRVSVSSEPAGAEIWIDGMRKGEAPGRWEVPPGRHVFAARMDGYASTGKLIDIQPRRRGSVEVELSLEAIPGGAPTAGPAPLPGVAELPAALMEGSGREVALFRGITDQVGARILLVLWIMPGDGSRSMVSLQVYDRQQDRVVASGLSPEVSLDPSAIGGAVSDTIRQALDTTAQPLLAAGPPPPPPPPWNDLNGDTIPDDLQGGDDNGGDDDDDDDDSIVSAWWFWTIIGAVVAGGAATGLYFGLTAGESASGPDGPQIILEF
ncbi:MAG: PEGA domain-containing protein [Deltaproteobacteria bacterium]|nr:PEGA domain-containing protein [Deltaproteobacteria bacterium]